MKDQVAELLNQAVSQLKSSGVIPGEHQVRIMVDNTRDKSHGDLASNIALTLAKPCGQPPRAMAEQIIAALPENSLISKVEIAGPGFINVFLAGASSAEIVADILSQGPPLVAMPVARERKSRSNLCQPTRPAHYTSVTVAVLPLVIRCAGYWRPMAGT